MICFKYKGLRRTTTATATTTTMPHRYIKSLHTQTHTATKIPFLDIFHFGFLSFTNLNMKLSTLKKCNANFKVTSPYFQLRNVFLTESYDQIVHLYLKQNLAAIANARKSDLLCTSQQR